MIESDRLAFRVLFVALMVVLLSMVLTGCATIDVHPKYFIGDTVAFQHSKINQEKGCIGFGTIEGLVFGVKTFFSRVETYYKIKTDRRYLLASCPLMVHVTESNIYTSFGRIK